MHAPDNAQLLRQTEFLNQRFDEKAFSWTLAMEAMETVLPANVQLTSIEPARAKDGHITVHLRVVGPRDRTVELVRNLERSRRFLLPRIIGESAESGNSSGQRLEPISISNRFDFDLLADYNPPTPEERATAATPANLKGKRAVAAPAAQPVRQPYTGSARSQSPWSKPNPATPLHRQPGGQQ
jgi:type IV pilus assembly protein PilN